MGTEIIQTGIDGCTVELMPIFGDPKGGVMHMLPGGEKNPEWYGGTILDVYSFYAHEKNRLRGGHYHPVLNELFFTVSGTALWILSDFRLNSPTKGKTIAFLAGSNGPENDLPSYTIAKTNKLARIRVPAGVYHAIAPLTDEGFTAIALGTTPYDKEDYRYPSIDEVPGMKDILTTFGISVVSTTTAPTLSKI